MFLKKLRKLDFVCHQCGATDRPSIAQVESIYDPCSGDPQDPPYIACVNCLSGILLPMRYTNEHEFTFSSELETKKNGKQV